MHYKDLQNNLHVIDPEFAHLLPAGCVQITDEEAETIRIANTPVVDPKDAIRAEIATLESQQMLPRVTREFMLLSMESQFTVDELILNFGYGKLKAFDLQITALRDQL